MADRPLLIDLRNPLLLKANELVVVTRSDGKIPERPPGLGLFYRDTCYLAGYQLRLNGREPLLLTSSASQGVAARLDQANGELADAAGEPIEDHAVGLRRTLLAEERQFIDCIVVRNDGDRGVILPLSLHFATRFENMFVLRGTPRGRRGRLHPPTWDGACLRFVYDGADGLRRSLTVSFSRPALVAPRANGGTDAHFEFELAPQASQELVGVMRVEEAAGRMEPRPPRVPDPAEVERAAAEGEAALLRGFATIETVGSDLDHLVGRSLADIALLRIRRDGEAFIAGGVPWFICLFGRDGLWPAIQCLAFSPELAACTARSLAKWQNDAGQIPHELRVGEMAHLQEVPQTPSYAAVDTTPLFLMAIGRHAEWTGRLDVFDKLRPHVDRALDWIAHGIRQGGGYLTYEGADDEGRPKNQAWRDSGTGVLHADGSFPKPPLSLVEVQGLAYEAWRLIAGLLRRKGEADRAVELEAAAAELRERVLRDFWMEAEGCYCLALEQGGRQVASVTSNAAHVLSTGIAPPEHARRIADRILRPDMFSGWGVRTLSANHPRFAPLAYQQGSVWPFDNSVIVAGLRRYGLDEAAMRVAESVLASARGFPLGRLPEFIAGLQRRPGDLPPHAPRADPLQAWSAGSVPSLVTELLGLRVEGFARRLRIERPALPEGIDSLVMRDLPLGEIRATLRFLRKGDAVRAELIGKLPGWQLEFPD